MIDVKQLAEAELYVRERVGLLPYSLPIVLNALDFYRSLAASLQSEKTWAGESDHNPMCESMKPDSGGDK